MSDLPGFITTTEFLSEHHKHRRLTLTLIETAKTVRQTRVAEMNEQVLGNLDRIITSLETGEDPAAQRGATSAG